MYRRFWCKLQEILQSFMCQKTAINICPSAAFISFAIGIFQHLRSEWRVEVELF